MSNSWPQQSATIAKTHLRHGCPFVGLFWESCLHKETTHEVASAAPMTIIDRFSYVPWSVCLLSQVNKANARPLKRNETTQRKVSESLQGANKRNSPPQRHPCLIKRFSASLTANITSQGAMFFVTTLTQKPNTPTVNTFIQFYHQNSIANTTPLSPSDTKL